MSNPPHICPSCGDRLALRVWVRGKLTDNIAASLTTTDPGDHVAVRRGCQRCDWGDRRELIVRAVQSGPAPADSRRIWSADTTDQLENTPDQSE